MRPLPPRRPVRSPIPRLKQDTGFWGGPGYWILLIFILGAGGIVTYEKFFNLRDGATTTPVVVVAPEPKKVPTDVVGVPDKVITDSILGENLVDKSGDGVSVVDDGRDDLPPPPPKFKNEDIDALTLRKYKTVSTRLTTAHLGTQISKEAKAAHQVHATPEEPLQVNRGDSGQVAHYAAVTKNYWDSIDPDRCVPHPDANSFPGKVADGADRVITAVNLVVNIPRWRSTGLYAAPGERITFRLNSEDAKLGLVARIGCHRDSLVGGKRDEWHRFPVITNTKALDKRSVEMANPFGGSIYIEMPDRAEWVKSRDRIRVEVVGAVEAPIYELGKTSRAEWDNRRLAPAPWGELVGEKMVLSVPSSLLRTLPYPEELMKTWDKVVETTDWLAAWGRRRSPERIVSDAEISIGWMHSGYPIMCYLASAPDMVNHKKLTTEGDWGFYHELGHNHQSGLWTYAGYGEVTCNLFALICMERISGQKVGGGHSDLGPLAAEMALDPVANKGSAFHLLSQYYYPILAFGWEPLQATFDELDERKDMARANSIEAKTSGREFREAQKKVDALEKEKVALDKKIRALDIGTLKVADKAAEKEAAQKRLVELVDEVKKAGEATGAVSAAESDEKKKEIFVKIWSKHCGHDLGPYFACFGWPYTDHMKAFNKGLKSWMPKNFPPKGAPLAGKAKRNPFGSRNEAMAGDDEIHGIDNAENEK